MQGIEYTETSSLTFRSSSPATSSPSPPSTTSRSTRCTVKMVSLQLSTATLNMRQPEGHVVEGKEDYVCKLKKGIYGLKKPPAGKTTSSPHWPRSDLCPTAARALHRHQAHGSLHHHHCPLSRRSSPLQRTASRSLTSSKGELTQLFEMRTWARGALSWSSRSTVTSAVGLHHLSGRVPAESGDPTRHGGLGTEIYTL